jgi:uncharacterized protein (TIGR02147 family)
MTPVTTRKQTLSPSEAAADTKPMEFLKASDYLKAIYDKVKESHHSYSYRQFADELGYGPTNYLHLICTGGRKLTPKAARTLADELKLRGEPRRYFELMVTYECARNANSREEAFAQLIEMKHNSLPPTLDRDMLEYLSEWYNPVIREMATLPEFEANATWIAERVFPKITVEQATTSLELLQRLGFLVKSESSGKLVSRDVHIKTGSVVRSMSVRRYHQIMLELARNALTGVKASERDFQAITIPVSDALVQEIKGEIDRFWKLLMEKSANCTDANRIYQLNIQLFPVSQTKPEDKEEETR